MNLHEASRRGWSTRGDVPTYEELNAGSLQRIADTLEALNRSWCGVQEQNVRFRQTIEEQRVKLNKLLIQNRRLKARLAKEVRA